MSSTRGIVASRPARGGPAPPCSRVEILHTANPTATSATARHLHGGKQGEGGVRCKQEAAREASCDHSLHRPKGAHGLADSRTPWRAQLITASTGLTRASCAPAARSSSRVRAAHARFVCHLQSRASAAVDGSVRQGRHLPAPALTQWRGRSSRPRTPIALGRESATRWWRWGPRCTRLVAMTRRGGLMTCTPSTPVSSGLAEARPRPAPACEPAAANRPQHFGRRCPPPRAPPPRARQGGLGSLSRGAGPAGTGLMTGPMVSCVDKCPRSCPPACAAPAPSPPPPRWTSTLWRESTRGCPCLARLHAPAAPLFAESYCWATITPAAGSEIPCMRTAHAATTYAHFMIIFGGWNGERELDDVFSFDTGEARGGSRHATLSGFVRSDQRALHSFCSFSTPCVFPARRGPALAGAQGVRPWTQRAAFPGAGGCSQAAHGVWRLQRHTLVQRRARDEPR